MSDRTENNSELLPAALLTAAAYPHATSAIKLIETHMSWVFLTGEYAYKVKKPVHLPFADFRSSAQRRFFCGEELRLNRRFAPDVYIAVVPILPDADNGLRVGTPAETKGDEEWAVQMRQFDFTRQADNLLDADLLAVEEMYAFGRSLARQHGAFAAHQGIYDPAAPMFANFDAIDGTAVAADHATELSELRQFLQRQLRAQQDAMQLRLLAGYVRECHGDLHLSNMVRLDAGLCAFDCLEFSQELRNIDVMSDVAFLFMDCLVRERGDLAYAFVDGYLNQSGDYSGTRLLPTFAAYRSMVRAKVAALRLDQVPGDKETTAKLIRYLGWTTGQTKRPPGRLLIMHGVSGSGKSYWAAQLVTCLCAIRIRSDVLRKVSRGIPVSSDSGAGIAEDLYAPESSARVYAAIAEHTQQLLSAGENVIVDATCLQREQRELLYHAADQAAAPCLLLSMTAPLSVLRSRIEQRSARGGDPSDADIEVLQWQLETQQLPDKTEPSVTIDTAELSLTNLLQLIPAR